MEKEVLTKLQELEKLVLLSADNLANIEKLALIGAKEALNVEDLALLSGLSKSHIYKLIWAKKIPYYKSEGGKLVFFKKSEVENWLCFHRVATQTETEQQAINYCVTNKAGKYGRANK